MIRCNPFTFGLEAAEASLWACVDSALVVAMGAFLGLTATLLVYFIILMVLYDCRRKS